MPGQLAYLVQELKTGTVFTLQKMLRTLLIGVLCLGMALAEFCRPEEDCWPSKDLIMELGKSLKGDIVMPSDSDYKNLTAMKVGG